MLATGLPATALTGLDLHQLDINRRFHCLSADSPSPHFSQRDHLGSPGRIHERFLVEFKSDQELMRSGFAGDQLPNTSDTANKIAEGMAKRVGGHIVPQLGRVGGHKTGFTFLIQMPDEKALELAKDPRILSITPDMHVSLASTPYSPNGSFSKEGGPEQPMMAAVRTEKEWKALWSLIQPQGWAGDPPVKITSPFPSIDFSRHTLLVAASGLKPSGGYSVAIDSVYDLDSRILVSVIERRPGAQCVVTDLMTKPIALALIPRTTKNVQFEITRTAVACG